ncbi:gamma-glutamyl-gamma-aminobutyrate hydrolase family protein [Fictibacillus fluitans]|uniref:Gamma-glutamyl-gamma-aminobutyrate hydrolase family protein n=1 Tax=Fictibacillus fluitans TaxID=3058422 RepID=A0ABT8HRI4_9BACL|nr:gamma-glutamyl-gamma-aminobutyrate hydrolase family protein [Fictibacillus sp. NE201]MDN4523130.1 gamma-glutamyl-gamma-aminobutyrate hydrolase family protein [Fictibacillus sp. NE201]
MNGNLPVIGITVSSTMHQDNLSSILNTAYSKAMIQAGGLPLLIPTVDVEAARRTLDLCDGLLLPGGDDIDPSFFGEDPIPLLGKVNPLQDECEIGVLKAALDKNKPILGICRGMGIINIALGGTMIQHVDIEITNPIKHHQEAARSMPTHSITVEENSLLYDLTERKTELKVNSFHHQAVKKAPSRLRPVAYASDGVIEAIESMEKGQFILGVQWHPEELNSFLPHTALLDKFINACRSNKKRLQ